jgi:hypothetical protein
MAKHTKTIVASSPDNQKIADLLALAAAAPVLTFAQNKSLARLYELVVLEHVLRMYVKGDTSRKVDVMNAPGGVLSLAASPCKADKGAYSYFQLIRNGKVEHEVWVSVEVTTLSWDRAGRPLPVPSSGKHEIDVGVFTELPAWPGYPDIHALHAGLSCKHKVPDKENVREALGLRRETALLDFASSSSAPWLQWMVPAEPPSPLYLVSSSPAVLNYAKPLGTVGVYMRYVPFPP